MLVGTGTVVHIIIVTIVVVKSYKNKVSRYLPKGYQIIFIHFKFCNNYNCLL